MVVSPSLNALAMRVTQNIDQVNGRPVHYQNAFLGVVIRRVFQMPHMGLWFNRLTMPGTIEPSLIYVLAFVVPLVCRHIH